MKLKVSWKLILYLVVLVLSAAPAVFVNTLVGYLPVMVVLFSGLLSFLWIVIIRASLAYNVCADHASCIRGEESPFRVFVENKSILPVVGMKMEFFLSDADEEETEYTEVFLSLSPKEIRSFGFDAGFTHIGAYKAGTRLIVIQDPFGIFRAERREEKSYSLEILPQVFNLQTLPVKTTVQAETVRARIQSPLSGSEYTNVREYAFGDPIKMIHWKLSAHAGMLMTKETESYSNTGVSVFLDMNVPESDREERLNEFDAVIEAGVAAGNYAAASGLDYDVHYYRKDGSAVRAIPASFRNLQGLVKDLHVRRPSEETRIQTLMEQVCRSVYSQANVIVCTTQVDNALALAMAGLKQRGLNPILFLVLSENLTERERENRTGALRQLASSNIPCRLFSRAEELEV